MIKFPLFPADILTFLILVAAALITFLVSQKLGLSLATSYLVCGVFLGPSGFAIIEDSVFLKSLGEIGILLLLFTIGLEIPMHRLKALRSFIFGLGTTQVLCSSLLLSVFFYYSGFLLDLPLKHIVILGLVFSFSSTAVIVQLLVERFEMTSNLGRKALSILLFQDMIAILLFVFLGMQSAAKGYQDVLFSLLGLPITLILAKTIEWCARKLFVSYRYYEATTPFLLLCIIGMGVLTQYFSLSAELGAFAAGLFLAKTPWRHDIHTELHPFRTLLLGIFFMTVGLHIKVGQALNNPVLLLQLLLGLMSLKTIVILSFSLIMPLPLSLRVQLASIMWGGSEFLFVVMPYLQDFLLPDIKNILLFVALISMMITPFIFALTKKILYLLRDKTQDTKALNPKIIISGFGHVGETIALILKQNFIPFLVIDYDETRIIKAKEKGYDAVLGNTQDIEFLKKLGIQHTKAFLLTFGHRTACVEIVKILRQKFPNLSVCVQVSDYPQANRFVGLGAHIIVPEPVESGMQMAALALRFLGFKETHTRHMIDFPQVPVFLGHTAFLKKFFNKKNKT